MLKVIKILVVIFLVFLIGIVSIAILSAMGISSISRIVSRDINLINYSEEFENIDKINLEIKYAELNIKKGQTLKVEASNMNDDWKIKQDLSVLKISNVGKSWNINNEVPILTIYIPEELELNMAYIKFGAGEMKIDYLKTKNIDLNLGAGEAKISNVNSQKTNIKCGAGEIIISESNMNDLNLQSGIGKVTYSGTITGSSNIDCGIGEVDILLKGDENTYCVIAEKGIGAININDNNLKKDATIGNGENKLYIKGGVGTINVNFE